jgi:hypothetical protein
MQYEREESDRIQPTAIPLTDRSTIVKKRSLGKDSSIAPVARTISVSAGIRLPSRTLPKGLAQELYQNSTEIFTRMPGSIIRYKTKL